MSLVARGIAYVSAVLIAFGALMPWSMVGGEPEFASPALVAIVCGYALLVTVATALRQRTGLSVAAVLVGIFAVYAIWTLPGGVADPASGPAGGAPAAGTGLVVIMVAALLLFLASWLPEPRRAHTVPADAEG